MKEIGGYFELELRKGEVYHKDAIALNTGRNALELILITKEYTKVYIPYYTCDVILEPFQKQKIEFEFYHINSEFEPVFDYSKIKENEGFLYTNYFGLKDKYILKLANQCPNLIIDSTQSFFSKQILNIPTFYSCRKFFGVPDGAYLYLEGVNKADFLIDYSENRLAHLLKRIEYDASSGYEDFIINDNCLIGQPIMQMSKLSKVLLCSIDYDIVQKKRVENFLFLQNKLSIQNEIKIILDDGYVPMVYPFKTNQHGLRQKLIDNKIYVATYWPNVLEWCKEDDTDFQLTQNIVALPIDQRYGIEEMKKITELI